MTRILLIDDEPRLLNTLARLLRASGYDVHPGSSYSEIEDRLHPGKFDVLITDILMPDCSGLEILRRVLERGCREPVLLITGEPNVESASEAVRLGAFDYLAKPVTKAKLLDAVARASRHVKLLRERDSAERREHELLKNLATIGESATMLVHEVKTPLGNLELALRAVADRLETDQRTVIEELVGRLRHLERLMRDTLAFAKPLDPGGEPFDVGEIVARVVRSFATRPEVRKIDVQRELPPAPVRRVAAPRLVEQLLNNLLDNAAQILRGKGTIRVVLHRGENGATLTVGDDGPGIAPDLREKVFEPFHSLRDGGTGLGLAICRKIATAHGWKLSVGESPLGGAEFTVDLGEEKRDD